MVKSHCQTKPERVNHHGQRQRGVTSIEYALIATVITVVIIGSVSAVGGANVLNWTTVADKILAALGG